MAADLRRMTVSITEFRALATKAALGAGLPPGQAQDFGRAALLHLCARRVATELQDALDLGPTGPLTTVPLAILSVLETRSDRTAIGTIQADRFAGLIQSYLESQPYAVTVTSEPEGFRVTFDLETPNAWAAPTRLDVPTALLTQFSQLAALTFVPDSAQSRAAGAGAGLTDND